MLRPCLQNATLRRLEDGPRQHRLSRELRPPLLQRVLTTSSGQQVEVPASPPLSRSSTAACASPVACAQSCAPHRHTTINEHRPKSAPATPGVDAVPTGRLGRKIGPTTAELLDRMLATKRHPEQGYRSCLGIMRLGNEYSAERLEAAAKRALELSACSYQSLKSILKCHLDRQTARPPEPARAGRPRSSQYPRRSSTSTPPTCCRAHTSKGGHHAESTDDRKLLRRCSCVAWPMLSQQQMEDGRHPPARFEERLGLLIDRQWHWRENRALERRLRTRASQGPACRRHRLPPSAQAGPQTGAVTGQQSAWVRETSESVSARADRNRQNLAGARAGAEGLP